MEYPANPLTTSISRSESTKTKSLIHQPPATQTSLSRARLFFTFTSCYSIKIYTPNQLKTRLQRRLTWMFLSSPLFAHEGRPAQACIRTVPTFHTSGFEAAHLSYTYIQQQSTNPTSHTHPSQLPRVFQHNCSAGHLIPDHPSTQVAIPAALCYYTENAWCIALDSTPPHSPPCQSRPRTFTTLFHDKGIGNVEDEEKKLSFRSPAAICRKPDVSAARKVSQRTWENWNLKRFVVVREGREGGARDCERLLCGSVPARARKVYGARRGGGRRSRSRSQHQACIPGRV
jgi:hypothetical protein